MGFYPYENFNIETKLSAEEIQKRLSEKLGAKPFFSFKRNISGKNIKPYSGWVTDVQFNIKKNITHTNSFLPIIEGSILQGITTQVNIKMKMQAFAIVFMMIWMGGVSIVALYLTIKAIITGKYEISIICPYIMLCFGYLLATFSFKFESSSSKSFLLELFDGHIAH